MPRRRDLRWPGRCARDRRVYFFEEPLFEDGIAPYLNIERSGSVTVAVPHLPHGFDPGATGVEGLAALVSLAVMEIVLGIDNIVFLAILSQRLPAEQQTKVRKKKNSPLYPKQTKENLPLELVYTAVPFLMVAVLFYFNVTTENFVLKTVANPDVKVNVTAFKWGWDFSYDGTKSPDDPAQEVHTVGTSTEISCRVSLRTVMTASESSSSQPRSP